jgi:hypothetical protein
MTDWRLINQAIIGINWLKEVNKIENADKTLVQPQREKSKLLYRENERILNVGVLMMACYIYFVYLREGELATFDFNKVDVSNFKINFQQRKHNTAKKICRRLRNSIAHSKFTVDHENNLIIFSDDKQGQDRIEFQSGIVELGIFIDNFVKEVYIQNIARI